MLRIFAHIHSTFFFPPQAVTGRQETHRTCKAPTAIARNISRFYVHFSPWQALPHRLCCIEDVPTPRTSEIATFSRWRAVFAFFLTHKKKQPSRVERAKKKRETIQGN
jgi:hypothetical protein